MKISEKLLQKELSKSIITSRICETCFQMFEDYDLYCAKASEVARNLIELFENTVRKSEKIQTGPSKPECVIRLRCNICKDEFKRYLFNI